MIILVSQNFLSIFFFFHLIQHWSLIANGNVYLQYNDVHCYCVCIEPINPLSAIVAIWHHTIVSFDFLAQQGFIGTWTFWLKCINEGLTKAKRIFWLVDVVPHSPFCRDPPSLAIQEQLALKEVKLNILSKYVWTLIKLMLWVLVFYLKFRNTFQWHHIMFNQCPRLLGFIIKWLSVCH